MKPRLLLVALVALTCAIAAAAVGAGAGAQPPVDHRGNQDYEVWLIDQKGSNPDDSGGTLHIFRGREVVKSPHTTESETVDLGGAVAQLCLARTGSLPRRPHMLVFNGGDEDGPGGNSHAVLAFVATGHIAFLDASSRTPLECIDVGSQAHAAWPTPDQAHLIVANQNGKLLQRISTDYAQGRFTLENDATINLATCVTPSGAPCQDPSLRPDNAPICPRTTASGAHTFVTLRGGGMFVVDHNVSPMRIVAEYDRAHVDDNGCGELEAAGRMYVNAGAGVTVPPVAGDDPQGHAVYAVELSELSATPSSVPNTPQVRLIYSRDGVVDAHATALTRSGLYTWWGDRSQNDVTVVDPWTDQVVNRFTLVGQASSDPAPDLFDLAPDGKHMFASLRGPVPATGGHDAVGSTPGLGVIHVRAAGRDGRLTGVARIQGVLSAPDPHAIRVRRLE